MATTVITGTTLKVNGAVSANATVNGSSQTLYTAPSNGYAIVQAYFSFSSGGTLAVGGRTIGSYSAGSTQAGIYIGPSQALVVSGAVGTTTALVSGVEFINSP